MNAHLKPSSTNKTYKRRMLLFTIPYVALNLAAIAGAADHLHEPGAWIFSLAVAAPIAGMIWAMLAWMRDSDEFLRSITAKRFIVAAGLAMAVVSTWGFLSAYSGAPEFPAIMFFPLFCGLFGLVSPFIRSTL